MTAYILLLFWLIIIGLFDIKSGRIPNIFIFFMTLCGVLLEVLSYFVVLDNIFIKIPIIDKSVRLFEVMDVRCAVVGVMLPLILLPLWIIRALGAGDIKLMMAIGIYIGSDNIFVMFYTFAVAALYGTLMLIRKKALFGRLKSALIYSALVLNTKSVVEYKDGIRNDGAMVVPIGGCAPVGFIVYLITTFA